MEIKITALEKTYRGGVHALQGLDLTIEHGMFGLLGPNGAGKTTLLRILATLLQPSRGRVVVGGFDLGDAEQKLAVRRMLGYLPQELSLYPTLTAVELLDYIAILKELHEPRERKATIERLLAMVGLERYADRKVKTLSGGMKRRLGIAQALINDPRLLIVDEPTAGLDPEERVRFRNLLAQLSGDRIVILSTHIIEDVATTCDTLAVLYNGVIRFHGSPAALLDTASQQAWELRVPQGQRPPRGCQVTSSVRMGHDLQLRMIGPRPAPEAIAVTPTLEEAYLALMRTEAA